MRQEIRWEVTSRKGLRIRSRPPELPSLVFSTAPSAPAACLCCRGVRPASRRTGIWARKMTRSSRTKLSVLGLQLQSPADGKLDFTPRTPKMFTTLYAYCGSHLCLCFSPKTHCRPGPCSSQYRTRSWKCRQPKRRSYVIIPLGLFAITVIGQLLEGLLKFFQHPAFRLASASSPSQYPATFSFSHSTSSPVKPSASTL